MLQNALADRCKLVIHGIPTHINGFALVAANHGPDRKYLVESNSDDVIPDKAVSIALDGRVVPIFIERPVPNEKRGMCSALLSYHVLGEGRAILK